MTGKLQDFEFFDEFVLRTPLLPFSKHIDYDYIEEISKSSLFREAVFLASPDSYSSVFENGDKVKAERELLTLYKYAARNSINCASFGISGGVSVGKFSQANSKITISNPTQIKRKIKLNTQIKSAFPQSILSDTKINLALKYYFNPSFCIINDLVKYLKQKKSRYTIVAIKHTALISYLISATQHGILLKTLRDDLVDQLEVGKEEVEQYLEKLIANQILISEFNFKPSSPQLYIESIIDRLISLQKNASKTDLQKILAKLTKANERNQKITDLAAPIRAALKIDTKEIFHVEMARPALEINLNNKLRKDLRSLICFLNKFLPYITNPLLEEFKKKFVEKYGEANLVPLMLALDRDFGLGFDSYNHKHPLVKQFKEQEKERNEVLDFDQYIGSLLLRANAEELYSIELTDQDTPFFNKNCEDVLPSSMYVCFEVLKSEAGEQLVFKAAAGSSAANIISRYSVCEEIEEIAKKITEKEALIYKNAVMAEILHVPPLDKSLNVVCRKPYRPYEIPVTAISEKEEAYVIPLTDIYLTVEKNKVILFSKKLKKEIIPRLTTMHSSLNSNYLYKFLASLQFDTQRESIAFNWRNYLFICRFFPRLTYKGIVFSPAQWCFRSKGELDFLAHEDFELIKKQIQTWRTTHKIPQCIFLRRDSGNNLFINFSSDIAIRVFLKEAKKSTHFLMIESFLSKDNLLVKDQEEQYYMNQCIGFMVQKKSQPSSSLYKFHSGDKVVYEKELVVKVKYVERNLLSTLTQVCAQLQKESKEELLYFYQVEDHQLSFVLKFKKQEIFRKKFEAFTNLLDQLFERKMILQYSVNLLEETEHLVFSELVKDQIFSFDSHFNLKLLREVHQVSSVDKEDKKLLFFMKSLDQFLNLFSTKLKNKLNLIDLLIHKTTVYNLEFRLKEINAMYQQYQYRIEQFFCQEQLGFQQLIDKRNKLYKTILSDKVFKFPQEHIKAVHFILSNSVNRLFFAEAKKYELVVYYFLKNYLKYQLYSKSKS